MPQGAPDEPQDDDRIPRGATLPRFGTDSIPVVKPSGGTAPEASPVLVLEDGGTVEYDATENTGPTRVDTSVTGETEPATTSTVEGTEPERRRVSRAPVIGAGVGVVGVVLALGLVVPGLLSDENSTQSTTPGPNDHNLAIATDQGSSTPSPTATARHTKDDKAEATKDTAKAEPAAATRPTSTTAPAAEATTKKSSPKSTKTSPKTTTEEPDWGTTVVHGGEQLSPGQSWSTNRIKLTLTSGGDVVLTDENGRTTWSAGVSGGDTLAFQGDGNLVLYQDGGLVWATETMDNAGAILTLQGDGNVTVALNNQTLWSAL